MKIPSDENSFADLCELFEHKLLLFIFVKG